MKLLIFLYFVIGQTHFFSIVNIVVFKNLALTWLHLLTVPVLYFISRSLELWFKSYCSFYVIVSNQDDE